MRHKQFFYLLLLGLFSLSGVSTYAQNVFTLKLNGVPCIQDGNTTDLYYSVPQDIQNLKVTVSYEGGDVTGFYIEDQLCAQGSEYSLEDIGRKKSYELKVLFTDNEVAYHLMITTLPIVCLDAKGAEIIKDKRTDCGFVLIDPLKRTSTNEALFTHKAGVKVRGASSSTYPKKSYSIELQDEQGEEVDASLLGLREDGDWILDAMYIDHARMRNRLCTDIWNSFNDVPHIKDEPEAHNGTRGYFVEVFLDGKYNGLYCFTEKIDRKQLKLKKYKDGFKGVSYKSNTWATPLGSGVYDKDEPIDGVTWSGLESEYPGEEGLAGWEYLQHFIDFVSPIYNKDKAYFAEELENHVCLDNIIDYILFLNAMYAVDNPVKNMFLSVYNVQKAERFFITPWDLDSTFGRTYDGSYLNKYAFTGGFPFSNVLFERLFEEKPCNFEERLKARWEELKQNQLSISTIEERIDNYKDLFVSSGAFSRELNLWPEKCTNIDEEAEFMKNWYRENYSIMDAFLQKPLVGIETVRKDESSPSVRVIGNQLIIEGATGTYTNVTITDISGKVLLSREEVIPMTIPLPFSSVYFVKLDDRKLFAVFKVVVAD